MTKETFKHQDILLGENSKLMLWCYWGQEGKWCHIIVERMQTGLYDTESMTIMDDIIGRKVGFGVLYVPICINTTLNGLNIRRSQGGSELY